MKIEIPDEWIARIGGCHPDTPVEQVFKIIRQMYPNVPPYLILSGEVGPENISISKIYFTISPPNSDAQTVQRIFERMAREDANDNVCPECHNKKFNCNCNQKVQNAKV